MVCDDSFISLINSFRKKKSVLFLGNYSLYIDFYFKCYWNLFVRSGILNSVHTFASDPSRGLFILIFLSLMIFISILILFKKFQANNYNLNSNSKETFILINNWFMIFYLITVLLGTIYPIFTEVLADDKVSVGPPFYNGVIIPVVVLFLLLMSVGPQIKWINHKFQNLNLILKILFLSILINFLIFYFLKVIAYYQI